MNLPELAVKRPVATGTILVLILIIGLVSLYQSPLDLLPDIQAPVLAVITVFPGSSPQETLELVTKPIEDGVSAVSGLTGLTSYSQENMSLVILSFDWGADVKRIRDDVGIRMDLISFPDGVQRPILLEFNPTLMPIMRLSASGLDDPVHLTEWLQETASPKLESVRGVASVQVQGGVKQDLFVRTSPETMAEYQVSFEQIANILRASLLDLPAGIIDMEDRHVRIRFLGRFTESDMLSDLIVGFKVDNEKLEEMIGQEVDINLNQMFSGQGNLFANTGSLTEVPTIDIYWDDIFDIDKITLANSRLSIPLQEEWRSRSAEEIENSLRFITRTPGITYDPVNQRMVFTLTSLGRTLINRDKVLTGAEEVHLDDVWVLEQAVWDSGYIIVPLDQTSLNSYGITQAELTAFQNNNPLIVRANPNQVLLAFQENWENLRREPIISIPDYNSWLSGVQSEITRGVGSATAVIEDGLTDLATTMILSSMVPGGSSFGSFELDGEFPIDPVYLGMLAVIEQDTYNPTTITRYNGQPSISLAIQKEGDANTVIVARQVRAALEKLSEESIAGGASSVTFNTIFDQAEEIERALVDLARSLIGGAILAILVLILFLKNWRTTMFIGLSIPTAIIATFSLLYFADITINLMTLGGLALAAGMLVDNAIVVSENIYRHYQMGEAPADAAVNGAREVAGAVTASTLTTISVFFPVVFLSGLAGQLFWEFALTVSCAILASLLVALTVIPMLASRSLRLKNLQEEISEKPHRLPGYRNMLKLAVKHPWWVLILALVFVGIGVFGYTTLGTELFPSPEESSFSVNVNLQPGATMDLTDDFVAELEKILAGKDEVDNYSTSVGAARFMGVTAETGTSNQARLRVEIKPEYTGEIERVIEEIRLEVERIPAEAEISFNRESLLDAAGLETRLDLVVSGPDLEQVVMLTEEAVELLAAYRQFTDVESSMEESRPEIHIRLDQGQAMQKGVTLIQVATAVRQALEGIPVSRIETDAGLLNIVLGYRKADFNTIEDLGRIGFYSPGGEYLHLDEVADLYEAYGPQSIPREDQQVVGQIQIRYSGMDLGSATDKALEIARSIELPPGYEIKTAGSSTLMGDVLSELRLVLVIAALLVYLVMAAQFESLLHPFIIICSLPLAYAGAILGLIITGNSISVPALIGIVVLSGILVNDGIIMVDFINQQRRIHGLRLKEAIIEGASARLRPILMTTATTVLGLLPLALGIGEGSQLQAPMAITIIGGQITGTLLLLLAIPSIYLLLTREQSSSLAAAGSDNLSVGFIMEEKPAARSLKTHRSNSKIVMRMLLVVIMAALIFYLFAIF
ncbi:MAG: efflux RND transporter permease subunit [Bacillota bacterium]|nr:efflux RND transporter permease subunit [Bacillota bacterium]